MTMRYFADEPCGACSTIAPRQVCGDAVFVDEHETSYLVRISNHATRCGDVRPVLFCSV
jgi:hypothetical protein